MRSKDLSYYIVSTIRVFEWVLMCMNAIILLAHIVLSVLCITGRTFQLNEVHKRQLFGCYLLLWGFTILEVTLALLQRIAVKFAFPNLKQQFNLILSHKKAQYRIVYRIYFKRIFYFGLVFVAELGRRYWLDNFLLSDWWSKFVGSMNFIIPFTSMISDEIQKNSGSF